MKLVHVNISRHIDFSLNQTYSLIVENPSEFYNLTNQLFEQTNGGEGDFVLSDKTKILDINKTCLFIYDYYGDIFNTKKITNIINNKCTMFLKTNDFLREFSKINSIMLSINEKFVDGFSNNIKFSDNFTYEDFIKISNYKLEKGSNLVENLLDYVTFFVENANVNVLIFVNLFSVLNEEQLNDFVTQLKYMQVNILLIDSNQTHKLKDVETIIIDKDLCVI